jgi:hypothetical protein
LLLGRVASLLRAVAILLCAIRALLRAVGRLLRAIGRRLVRLDLDPMSSLLRLVRLRNGQRQHAILDPPTNSSPFGSTGSDADGDLVIHLGDARRRPGGTFRLLAFGPGTDGPAWNHFAANRLDRDAFGVEFRATFNCFLNFTLDVRRGNTRLHLDRVGDAFDALDMFHRARRAFALVVPLDMSFKCNPAIFDDSLDIFPAIRKLRLEGRNDVARDFRIRPLVY